MLGASAARGCTVPQSRWQRACDGVVSLWTLCGLAQASCRGRLLAYPVAFWVGIGHRLDYECRQWLHLQTWRRHFLWQSRRLLCCCVSPLRLRRGDVVDRVIAANVAEAKPCHVDENAVEAVASELYRDEQVQFAPITSSEQSELEGFQQASGLSTADAQLCGRCGRVVEARWPPPQYVSEEVSSSDHVGGAFDGDGNARCWSCWRNSAVGLSRQAALLAEHLLLREVVHSGIEGQYASTNRLSEVAHSGPKREADVARTMPHKKADVSALENDETVACVEGRTVQIGSPSVEVVTMNDKEDTFGVGASRCKVQEDACASGTEGNSGEQCFASAATQDVKPQDDIVVTDEEKPKIQLVHEAATEESSMLENTVWSEKETSEWMQWVDDWWWRETCEDKFDTWPSVIADLKKNMPEAVGDGTCAAEEPVDPRLRRLCLCVEQVDTSIGAVGPNTALHSLDSLRVALLAARIRAEFGMVTALSIARVRKAMTVAELLEVVVQVLDTMNDTGATSASAIAAIAEQQSAGAEYRLWFSPGQHGPMGAWVMRSDKDVCPKRLEEATRRLVDRHAALRASPNDDEMRLLSFLLDTSVLFSLVARLLDQRSVAWSSVRRCISWALWSSWPRVIVSSRDKMYAAHPAQTPFEIVTVNGQTDVEATITSRREILGNSAAPLDVVLVRLEAQLVGCWVFSTGGGNGGFVIREGGAPYGNHLVYADLSEGLAGVLVGPDDPRWVTPPWGLSALLCARLSPTSNIIWLRHRAPLELTVLWKKDDTPDTQYRRRVAFRMPSQDGALSVFNYLAVSVKHSLADGHSFEAVVGDLLTLYASTGEGGAVPPPPPPMVSTDSLDALQRRLKSTLYAVDPLVEPQQVSLRGNLWNYRGRGYGHSICLQRGSVKALQACTRLYGVPFDVLMLGLTASAIARAGVLDVVSLTMYVPMRDGPGEAGGVGLFADWRSITVPTDTATATVLGVVLEVAFTLRTRNWVVFNALAKPESFVVNFQPMDQVPPGARAGFVQLGEGLWRTGERLQKEKRSDQLGWAGQALSVKIEAEDRDTWWLLIGAGIKEHPPSWMRRFVLAYRDALYALMTEPMQRVHVPYPHDFY
eukprot:TRINITY_DN34477_c0_g1_i1.p1 TRINITY_DN34477_c0_g1~~TRINITY_DN34477_c0_g1_i1.p1  ORF type:complete len:1135 (-),score=192.44 TRINITY_DN34477_c0_g1_i1:168-3473(-)